jgi:hypothetical protein
MPRDATKKIGAKTCEDLKMVSDKVSDQEESVDRCLIGGRTAQTSPVSRMGYSFRDADAEAEGFTESYPRPLWNVCSSKTNACCLSFSNKESATSKFQKFASRDTAADGAVTSKLEIYVNEV